MKRDDAVARILCAVDTTDIEVAKNLSRRLEGRIGGLKLGLEFFHSHGPAGVAKVIKDRHPLFLDLKMHDIPNTVAGGMRAIAPLRPFLTTVHASGGAAMLRSAMAAAVTAGEAGFARPKVLAITLLTSIDTDDLAQIGMKAPVAAQVLRLADLALKAGTDGVVCSAHEVKALRKHCGDDFLLVVPGVRPTWSTANDQKRIVTPAEAIAAGADYLVVGRPITQARDPVEAVEKIAEEMAG